MLHRANLFIVLLQGAGSRTRAAAGCWAAVLGGGARQPMGSSSGLPREPLDRSGAALTWRNTAEGGQGGGKESGRPQTLWCARVAGPQNDSQAGIRSHTRMEKRKDACERATGAQHAQHITDDGQPTGNFGTFPSCPSLRISLMTLLQQRPRLIDELLTPDFLAQNLLPWLSPRDYFRASGVCRCFAAACDAARQPLRSHWATIGHFRRQPRSAVCTALRGCQHQLTVPQPCPSTCRAWRDAVCEDAAAPSSPRRSPRHWGRLEATTRGNATLKLAAEPAWAAAFQPWQAAEDDEVAVPAALGAPGAPQDALPHLPVLSQAAWHAEQLPACLPAVVCPALQAAEDEADAILTTAHKFKGKEQPFVQLADDFMIVAEATTGQRRSGHGCCCICVQEVLLLGAETRRAMAAG
jgi:hypothetical protein